MRSRYGPWMWAVALSMTLVVPSDVRAAEPPVSVAPPPATTAPAVSATAADPFETLAQPVAAPNPADAVALYTMPAALPTPTPAPARRDTDQGKREAGWTMVGVGGTAFAITYLGTAFAGAAAWDAARGRSRESGLDRQTRRDLAYGASLMVPVVGPFVGVGFSGSATRSVGLAISGVLQASGVFVALLGARKLVRLRRAKRLSVSAGATATSTHAAVTLRF